MTNLVDRFRLMRARRRWMRPPSPSRSGAFGVVLLFLALAVVTVTVLDRRGEERETEIVEYALDRRVDPLVMARDLAGSRPIVIVGDVAGAAGPRRFAVEVIATMARGPGLDYVALEIGSDLQPLIDRYLDSAVDDASALVAEPRAIRPVGGGADFLGVYRRVRELNAELGLDRRIRILAIDAPDWPPAGAQAPARMLPRFAARDEHMMRLLEERILSRDERARTLIIVDGMRALDAAIRLATGGGEQAEVPLLARRLRATQTGRVASIIVDAPATATGSAWVGYRASRLNGILRVAAAGQPLAFPLRPGFPATTDDLVFGGPPGLEIALSPTGAPLSALADAYVRLPN